MPCYCVRWLKLRGSLVPCIIIAEPMIECGVLGLLSGWAVTVMFGWSALAFFFVHLLLWFILDYFLLIVVQVSAQQANLQIK